MEMELHGQAFTIQLPTHPSTMPPSFLLNPRLGLMPLTLHKGFILFIVEEIFNYCKPPLGGGGGRERLTTSQKAAYKYAQ